MSETHVPTQQPPAGSKARVPASDVDTRRAGDREGATAQGPAPARGLSSLVNTQRQHILWRVERRRTFEALRQARRRQVGPITVTWVAGDPAQPVRVAFAIGRRAGSAVVRNRLRRRLRMLMREAAPQLSPGAYLIGASASATLLSYEELRDSLMQALELVWRP